jgi:hypothetical protein
MLTEKLIGAIPKLLIGALMGVVVGFTAPVTLLAFTLPLGPLLAVGLVLAGFGIDVVMANQHATRKKREIARFFDKEIGAALGKDPELVTVQDAQAAARGETVDGQPVQVVQHCFEAIGKAQRQETIMSMISTALTGVFSFAAGAVLGGMFSGTAASTTTNVAGEVTKEGAKQVAANVMEYGKVGKVIAQSLFGSTAMKIVTDTVTQAYNSYHPVPSAPPVFENLRKLEGRMDYNDPIPAFPLLSMVLQLRPALQDKIREEYGAPFEQLDQLQKREAFLEMEEMLHLKEAARKLTHGEITLPQFGVMLFGQQPLSPPPPVEYAQARARNLGAREQDIVKETAREEAQDAELMKDAQAEKPTVVKSFVEKYRPNHSQHSSDAPVLWKDRTASPTSGLEGHTLGFH